MIRWGCFTVSIVYLLSEELNSKLQNTFYTRGEFKNEAI